MTAPAGRRTMDGRATAVAASASIQRSTRYEELVRRQLNCSADSSASNSVSLPPYDNDENDAASYDSDGAMALDDCSSSTASSGVRKKDIREVQDYLERLDQKRGILERHASAELVRPCSGPSDSLRRAGSVSLPGTSRLKLQPSPPAAAAPTEDASSPADAQPPSPAPLRTSAASPPQPALRAPLTTPRAASVTVAPPSPAAVAGRREAARTAGGSGLTGSGTYEVLTGSGSGASGRRAGAATGSATENRSGTLSAANPLVMANRDREACRPGSGDRASSDAAADAMPQLTAAEEPASVAAQAEKQLPQAVSAAADPSSSSDASAAAAASAAEAVTIRMRLVVRDEEALRQMSAEPAHSRGLRESPAVDGGTESDGGAVSAPTSDRRLAAVLRERAELERRCDDLLREKENLTTELRKLRDELDALRASVATDAQSEAGRAGGGEDASAKGTSKQQQPLLPPATVDERLLSYRPDNPNALQRKIDDLECQIQDLLEANETACEEVQRLEAENQQLCEEIGALKASHQMALMELETECRRLQEKLAQLQRKSMTADDLHLHSQIQQLQIDLRAQQEKNRVLTEENTSLRNALNDSGRARFNDVTGAAAVNGHRPTDVAPVAAAGSDARSGPLGALHRLQLAAADVTAAAGAEQRFARLLLSAQSTALPDTTVATKHGPAHAAAAELKSSEAQLANGAYDDALRRSDGATPTHRAFTRGLASGRMEPQRRPTNSTVARTAAPPSGGATSHPPGPRCSSPAGRSDLSDSTAVLLAGYEPLRRGAARPLLGVSSGRATNALPAATGVADSSAGVSAPHAGGCDDVLSDLTSYGGDLEPAGYRTSLPPYIDEEDACSDTTADILQDIATYIHSHKGHHDAGGKTSSQALGGAAQSTYDSAFANGYYHTGHGSVSSSSSLSSLDEQPMEDDDFSGPHRGGLVSPKQNTSAGLRTVTSPLQVTQHNRSAFDGSSSTLSVAGRRPFAPRTPADLRLGDIIKYTRPDCRIARGVVKYIGHLHNKADTYVGIETEYNDGKHDGVYDGSRYFQCKPNRGAFIPFTKVIMVWGG